MGYDIVKVIGELGIEVRESSSYNYIGLCPFHTEKTPSFTIFSSTNSWYCFGCGGGNSVIDLVMQYKGLNFLDAKKWLTAYALDDDIIELPSLTPKYTPKKILPYSNINYWHNLLLYSKRDSYFINRKFSHKTIYNEGFGWDGKRYIIPIWQGKPRYSHCLGIRKRASELLPLDGFKYVGKKGFNSPYMWGKYHTLNSDYMFMFAGELDAALAVQDGLPATSIVGGILSYNRFPSKWPFLWFPHIKHIILVFDKKEAVFGGNIASKWEYEKGRGTASIFHWVNDAKDYNEYRFLYSKNDFLRLVSQQGCFSK